MASRESKTSSRTRRDDGARQRESRFPKLGPRAIDVLSILVLLIATLIVTGDILFGGDEKVLTAPYGDLLGQFLGWRQFAFGQMSQGHLPLWNPYVFSGAPFLGGFQSALLYPPNWIYIVLPIHTAFNVDITLHLFLSGVFTYIWARRRGLHPAASVVGGLVFMLGGPHFLHVFAGHLPNLCTMAWAPLVFLAIDEVTQSTTWRGGFRGAWIGAGAVAMQVLAGHPQYVYYTAIIAGLYSGLNLVRAPRRTIAIVGLLAIVIGGAGLASGQLLAGLQATGECVRSRLDYSMAHLYPLPPENLLTLAIPDLFGNFSTVPYWGRWLLWEDSLFIGVAALTLFVFGAVCAPQKIRRFSVAMAVIALLVAVGYSTPLYSALYRALPGFSSFRGVSKFSYLALLFLAMGAAAGMDQLLHSKIIARWPAALLASCAGILLIGAGAIGMSAPKGPDGWWGHAMDWPRHQEGGSDSITLLASAISIAGVHAVGCLVLCALTCFALASVWMVARRWNSLAYAVGLIAAIELCTFARMNRGAIDFAEVQAANQQMVAALSVKIGPDERLITNMPGRLVALGALDAWGTDPMILRRYAEAFAWPAHMSPDRAALDPAAAISRPAPIWRLFRISTLVDITTSPPNFSRLKWPVPMLQSAQLVPLCIVVADDQQALAILNSRSFDPRQVAVLESRVNPMPPTVDQKSAGAQFDGGQVQLTDLSPDEIEIHATTDRPVILVISDNYAAGWKVRSLDAAPPQSHYEVVPVDHALRGIPLAAGSHHLRLEYRPSGWIFGRWISFAALLGYLTWGGTCSNYFKLSRKTTASASS